MAGEIFFCHLNLAFPVIRPPFSLSRVMILSNTLSHFVQSMGFTPDIPLAIILNFSKEKLEHEKIVK